MTASATSFSFGHRIFVLAVLLFLAGLPRLQATPLSLEGGNITIDLPDGFALMAPEEKTRLFPREDSEVYSSADDMAAIAFGFKSVPLRPDQLPLLKSVLPTDLVRAVPGLQWIKSDMVDLDGTKWIYCEFISPAPGGDFHSYYLFTSYRGLEYVISFHIRVSAFATWSAAVDKSLHSITVKPGTVDAAPDSPPVSAGEAVVRGELAKKQHQFEESKKYFQAALSLQPNMSRALLGLGEICMDEESYDVAVKYLSDALAADPRSAQASTRLGMAKGNLGEYDEAMKDLNSAISLNPDLSEAYYARAIIEARHGDFDGAAADLEHILKRTPRNTLALHGRGWLHFIQGDYDDAHSDFQAALAIQQNYPEVYYDLACVALAQNQTDAAQRDLQTSLQTGPQGSDAGDSHLLLWAIQSRQGHGDEAKAELTTYLQDDYLAKRAWVKNVGAYLIDQKSESDLIASANLVNAHRDAVVHTRIWYFIGLKRQITGDDAGAKDAFQKCLGYDVRYSNYHILAKANLDGGAPQTSSAPVLSLQSNPGLVLLLVVAILSFFFLCLLVVGIVIWLAIRSSRQAMPAGSVPPPPPTQPPSPPMQR